MANRTFGWVQNPAKFSTLKDVVAVFEKDSYMHKALINERIPKLIEYNLACDSDTMQRFINLLNKQSLVLPYSDLKGRGAGSRNRGDAKCSGIIQAVLTGQKYINVTDKNGEIIRIKKPYQDDWSTDGWLRWAISVGLLNYDNNTDTCCISESGKKFINTEHNSVEEKTMLGEAYLSYPPAVRILSLLSTGEHLTKFELGSKLGFIGEAGFTSIPQNIYVHAYNNATTPAEKTEIRNNVEGSSDKYARMIAGWLCDIGWVERASKEVKTNYGNKEYSMKIGQSFLITAEGLKNLKKAYGSSSSKRIPKIVFYEMLATKISDSDYVRGRRAYLIKYLLPRDRTVEECTAHLKIKGFDDSEACIIDDIHGLQCMGISVRINRGKYRITDEIIKLDIPVNVTYTKTDLTIIKDTIRNKLKHINHKYLNLIDLSFDGDSDKEFEIQTIDLLTNELSFTGMRLGGSRKPDGIISYNESGVIIDNKAYSVGYSLPIPQADEMVRYIGENQRRNEKENPNKWWDNFDNKVKDFYFLFVSSIFTGGFTNRLENISIKTGINGGAINSQNLLYLSEKLKCGELSYDDSFKFFGNKEIMIMNCI